MKKIIGIDIGGTVIKGVLINELGEVLHRESIHTNDQGGFSGWKNFVGELAGKLKEAAGEPSCLIGIAAPGIPDELHSAISFMPGRLDGIENFNWAGFLGEKEVFVLNDAHAALMAEARFGAGKGLRNIVLLTLGTGVGGGILIEGKLYTGLGLMAGHLGHITIDASRDETGITGSPGTLEQAIGNSTVSGRSSGRFGSTSELVDAFIKGDNFAMYVWLDSVRKLSLAICSISNALSPDAVILGGGITNAGDNLFKPLKDFMDVYEWRPGGKSTRVLQAQFSELSGAVGAAAFTLAKSQTQIQ
jgi:glucokinase